MRTAQYAGLVAGAVCLLQGLPAVAGEGSSLRGLKPPKSSPEAYQFSTAHDGLRVRTGSTELAPRLLLSGGTWRSQTLSAGEFDYRYSLHQPAGQNIAALAEPGAGNLGDVLPRYTLDSRVNRRLSGGWGIGFGVRQSEYNFSTANLLSFSAERAFGNWRSAYTLYSNVNDGAALGSAHRFELNYLYGDRNTVGLAYTTGRDVENFGTPAALAGGDVKDLTLSGRHWLSPNWAVTYDVMSQEQPLTRRQGLRLGVSRSF